MKIIDRIRRLFHRRTRLSGRLRFDVYNPDGSFDRSFEMENSDTNVGVNNLLDVYFNAAAQTTAWYLGLIDNAGFSAVAASDTMASHSGWNESTAYSETTRPQWVTATASGQAVTTSGSSLANFTANTTVTVKGVFLTTSNTKGGTGGTLFSTATGTAQSFTSGQLIKVTYTKSCTIS